MPTPLDLLLDPLSLIVFSMFALFMLYESLFPAKQTQHISFWKTQGAIFFLLFFFLSSYLPLLIEPFMVPYQLFSLTDTPISMQILIGLLIYELAIYVWHRTLHENGHMWRYLHQMHHSAERLDTYGTFYFSPLDMVGFTFLGSICFALLIGFEPLTITSIILATSFFSIFQHANIKTPRWIGYFIQRPESHSIHHKQGFHKSNYSDLPIIDMLFGTFNNPLKHSHQTGFFPGGSHKILAMLRGQEISNLNTTPQEKKGA